MDNMMKLSKIYWRIRYKRSQHSDLTGSQILRWEIAVSKELIITAPTSLVSSPKFVCNFLQFNRHTCVERVGAHAQQAVTRNID